MDDKAASVVQIDENALDKECVRLPSDYLKYAFRAAEAKRDVDEYKSALDVVSAELGKEVRDHPAKFGLEKVTESALNAVVLTQGRYQTALASLAQARYDQEVAQAVVWALEHKKRSLTLLVELHGMSYFSKPKVSEAGRDAVEQMIQRKVRRRDDED